MYVPEHFKETDPRRIAALLETHPFGMLVTAPKGVPFVSHLPFAFDPSAGPRGTLAGHLARENPQWRHLAAGREALVVFQGPNAYVSPAWYASPGVPTWNYAVVHMRGKPLIVEDESRLKAMLAHLTDIHESDQAVPWTLESAGNGFSRLFRMIVGFEIEVTEVRAKFKLSQNRPEEERQSVARELASSPSSLATGVAKLMSENN